MARPRGYQKPYGNEALRQLREWTGLTPTALAEFVEANGGQLSAQHVRNIEARSENRVYPSEALLDQILTVLHFDREALERVRSEIAVQHENAAYERPAATPNTSVLLAAAVTDDADDIYQFQAQGLPPATWSAAVEAAPPTAKSLMRSAPVEDWGVRHRRGMRSAGQRPLENAPLLGARAVSGLTAPASAATPASPVHTPAAAQRKPLLAPPAPTPLEAVGELGTIYSQLDNTGRLALIGRARELQMRQTAQPSKHSQS